MRSRHLPWLVAVPLMAAGAFAARAATYVCVPSAGGESGNEAAERLRAGAPGVQWPLVLGVIAALVVVAALVQLATVWSGRHGRRAAASTFFWLPPLAFLGQEIGERALHAEALVGTAALAHLATGLALQLPFALLAFLLAHALRAAVHRLARALGGRFPFLHAPMCPLRGPPGYSGHPSRTLLALGHPQRGPPPGN
jgi:hypothetical protein